MAAIHSISWQGICLCSACALNVQVVPNLYVVSYVVWWRTLQDSRAIRLGIVNQIYSNREWRLNQKVMKKCGV